LIYLSSSTPHPVAGEIAAFLRAHRPFDTLDDDQLAAVAAAAEVEVHHAGTTIMRQATPRPDVCWVVRRGGVELLTDGRVLDLMGEGELFGYTSMLAEAPPQFTARASVDVELLRIPEHVIRPVLERPAALQFVVSSLSHGIGLLARGGATAPTHLAGRPVRELIRAPALVCAPRTTVRDAAGRMVDASTTSIVVQLDGGLGIVTDHDLRTRVVAAGAGADTPIQAVMTAPARTVAGDLTATEALLEMLDHGIRHLIVLDAHRHLLGVIDDVDLMASERRAPFRLRAQIAGAADVAALAQATSGLGPAIIALHDARAPAETVSRVLASIHDTIVRRLIELAEAQLGPAPAPYAWFATGSFARREPFPGSDADSALAWDGPEDDEIRAWMLALARFVTEGQSAVGLVPDDHGAVASSPLFNRSIGAWEQATGEWLQHPDRDKGLMLLSVVVESAPVWGAESPAVRLAAAFARAPTRELTLRQVAIGALADRPPTGFLRDFVLESGGERRGKLDIKRGGMLPIVNLARWGALSAGVTAASTRVRLQAAQDAGMLEAADVSLLRDAFDLLCALRMEHQVEQLRAGVTPDNLIDPARLNPLTRNSLKETFRAVARVQRGVALTLGLSGR